MLKFIYSKQDEIPEALREHYTESNGKWVLNCEGAAPSAKVDEFRQNNIELKKKLDRFKDVDPEKYRELLDREASFEAPRATDKTKVEELVAKRTAQMAADHDKALSATKADNESLRAELARLQIDGAVTSAASEFGLRSSASEDVISRARSVWRLGDDGKPVAMNGDEKIYGRAGEPISMKEWVETLSKSAPHLFEPNGGSNASGSGAGSAGSDGINPWADKTWNLTKQAEMLKSDPAKARRMASMAGKQVAFA